jgi:hypothetical protein
MNDPQWLEASRKLAERVIRQSNQTDARLNYLGEVLLARDWAPREKQALENALTKFQSTYAKDQSKAEEVLKVGESNRETGIRPDELASWMLVASAAMNLDAVLNK